MRYLGQVAEHIHDDSEIEGGRRREMGRCSSQENQSRDQDCHMRPEEVHGPYWSFEHPQRQTSLLSLLLWMVVVHFRHVVA